MFFLSRPFAPLRRIVLLGTSSRSFFCSLLLVVVEVVPGLQQHVDDSSTSNATATAATAGAFGEQLLLHDHDINCGAPLTLTKSKTARMQSLSGHAESLLLVKLKRSSAEMNNKNESGLDVSSTAPAQVAHLHNNHKQRPLSTRPIRVLQIGCNLGVEVLLAMRALSDDSTLPEILKKYVEFGKKHHQEKGLDETATSGSPEDEEVVKLGSPYVITSVDELEAGAEFLDRYSNSSPRHVGEGEDKDEINRASTAGMQQEQPQPEGICVEPLPSNTRFVTAFLEEVNNRKQATGAASSTSSPSSSSSSHGATTSRTPSARWSETTRKKNLNFSVFRAAVSNEAGSGIWRQWPNSTRYAGQQDLHIGSCLDFRSRSPKALQRYESCARASHNRVPTHSAVEMLQRLKRMRKLEERTDEVENSLVVAGRDEGDHVDGKKPKNTAAVVSDGFAVDLLRIDTEGYDPAVLQSLREDKTRLLTKLVRFLVFEKHTRGVWEYTTLERETKLLWEEAGFRCFIVDVVDSAGAAVVSTSLSEDDENNDVPPAHSTSPAEPELRVYALSPSPCWHACYEGTNKMKNREDHSSCPENVPVVPAVEDIFCVNRRDHAWSAVMEDLLLRGMEHQAGDVGEGKGRKV
ncbi:unnamed protein product [Amoebophrya sp. A120]|nr:unnamed protein product [Amoebophrya sp. A120]|eukprot:GSA120T00007297001.1